MRASAQRVDAQIGVPLSAPARMSIAQRLNTITPTTNPATSKASVLLNKQPLNDEMPIASLTPAQPFQPLQPSQRSARSETTKAPQVAQNAQVAPVAQAGPVLKYRGSKWRLAPWILNHFPGPATYTTYLEPYFGSGAVFFTKLPTKHEIINDLSGDVVNLFRVLREQGEQLATLVALTPWARLEYEASLTAWEDETMRAFLRGMNPLEAARRFLVRCWQAAHLDLSRTTIWRHRGPAEHSSTTILWQKLPARIAWTVERLQQAEIECRPALDLIARHNSPRVLLYVDPPYPLETRGKRQLYQHEMSDADHLALLTALEQHQGPVVLSSYANPLYDRQLAHWQRFEKAAVAEGGGARTEVLWVKPAA